VIEEAGVVVGFFEWPDLCGYERVDLLEQVHDLGGQLLTHRLSLPTGTPLATSNVAEIEAERKSQLWNGETSTNSARGYKTEHALETARKLLSDNCLVVD